MIIEIFLSVLLLTSAVVNIIQLRRQETLETWLDDMSSDLNRVQKEFEIIDEKNWFESDDEVGDTFNRLRDSLNKLNKYTGVDDNSMVPGTPERNKLFSDTIYHPIRKIAENLIHTYKFYYFDVPTNQVIDEVVANMVINMHKYIQEKGKAFSYFSVVAKNYLILHNNNNYKMGKIHDMEEILGLNVMKKFLEILN